MSQSLSNTKENVTASGLRKFAKEYTMLLFVIVLVIACMLFVDRFATPGNLMNVLIQIAINALIATGMTFVILSDGIDLSVGSVAALAGVVATATIKMFPDAGRGLSVLVILLAAIVVGGICGSINAFSVAKLNVPPFIATLAMMNIARGLAFVYTDSKPVFDLPDSYGWVGLRSIGPIPVTVIVMIIVLAASCFPPSCKAASQTPRRAMSSTPSRRSPWAAQACRADAAASFRPYSALSPSASSTTL